MDKFLGLGMKNIFGLFFLFILLIVVIKVVSVKHGDKIPAGVTNVIQTI